LAIGDGFLFPSISICYVSPRSKDYLTYVNSSLPLCFLLRPAGEASCGTILVDLDSFNVEYFSLIACKKQNLDNVALSNSCCDAWEWAVVSTDPALEEFIAQSGLALQRLYWFVAKLKSESEISVFAIFKSENIHFL
jgi:hypothetical protein